MNFVWSVHCFDFEVVKGVRNRHDTHTSKIKRGHGPDNCEFANVSNASWSCEILEPRMMKRKLIRDAVHGDIEAGPLEIELMDTPEFQRLRGIKQLGTAYLVFPSAVHTRFEHSLGTSWMAHRVLQSVRRSHPISVDDENLIRVSALLHDITHIPF